MIYFNKSSQKYKTAGDIATAQGNRPGSGEWWKALREIMAANK